MEGVTLTPEIFGYSLLSMLEEQGWCSGEGTCLSPEWPGLESWCWCYMFVEVIVGSVPCSVRFFSVYFSFHLSLNTNTSKFQFDLECMDTYEVLRTCKCSMGKQNTKSYKKIPVCV